MKKEIIKDIMYILIVVTILCFIVIYLINKCTVDLKFILNFDLYNENHTTYEDGEVTLYNYYEKDHCFSSNEKEMISTKFKMFNLFDNDVFAVSECGDISISFDVKDYESFGYIYLYSTSSFEELKKRLEFENIENIEIFDSSIYINNEEVNISIYSNGDNDTFRIIYIIRLPYRYKINELDTYSSFTQYFLKLNLKNIDEGID